MYWTPLLLLFGLLIGGSHSPGQVSSIGSGVLCTHPANGSKPEHMFIRSLDVGVVHWGSSGGASGHDMLAAGEGLDGQPLQLEPETPGLGELCVAIGSPHSYRESASLGIISGLSRQIRMADGTVIEEMIQTDASVNPGNSGGPLVNIHGRVVGMNTIGPAETVNMAVPAETIAAVVPELVSHGSILRASLGISIALIDHSGEVGLQRAISVRKVKAADQSPLQSGDILLAINGQEVNRRIDVIRALGREMVDRNVSVLIQRNGSTQMVEVLAKARISTKAEKS